MQPIQRKALYALLIATPFLLIGALLSPLYAADGDLPEWLDRVEYSVEVQTDKKPTFYLQTVQPLHQDLDKTNTVFMQPRVSLRDGRTTYNLGVGYRRLVSENLLLGINTFFDYQDLHRHARAGLGVEALGQIFEARANSYFGGLTEKRVVNDTGASQTIERVVDGADVEFGAPLPYLPWLKVYGGASWYDYKTFKDNVGWKTRVEAKLNDNVRFEFFTLDDNKGDTEYGGRFRFQLAFASIFDFKDSFKLSDEPFPKKDLSEETLIPVERNFDIVVEKVIETGGLTIEAGRS